MKSLDIDLVIFDCDGTLVDSEYVNSKSISEMLVGLGYNKFTLEYCVDYFAGCSIHDVRDTLKSLKVESPEKELEKMHMRSMDLAHKELVAIQNVPETLEKIRIPKCVASNGEQHIVRAFLNITKLMNFFTEDSVFTRELVKNPKPSPELYLHAAKQMGNVPPERCLVIEDSVVGVTAGKSSGMSVIGFVGANHHHKESENLLLKAGAFTTIKDFSEILDHFNAG
jgi:HAD superfamily hydrolase (TIGR01509 family)